MKYKRSVLVQPHNTLFNIQWHLYRYNQFRRDHYTHDRFWLTCKTAGKKCREV